MSEMVERVAKAVREVTIPIERADGAIVGVQQIPAALAERVALAAIAAMREPTEAMSDAALDADLDVYWGYMAEGPGKPGGVWRAMIVAALAE